MSYTPFVTRYSVVERDGDATLWPDVFKKCSEYDEARRRARRLANHRGEPVRLVSRDIQGRGVIDERIVEIAPGEEVAA